ncbi:MAG: DNA-directed RNA polymerase subunit alpha [Chloroflexi bacterium]|nr:DNA-directed RNA polymerase subunit alpha [Chloroflexota bacterium]
MLNPKIEYKDITNNYGRFIVEPLDSGFGTSLGNALRRTLLALLPGAAITSVRIEEVQHEISTIPGMKEDTIEFLLNVKEIRLRPLSDRPGKLTLDVHGPKKITAGDIKASADFEIINPNLHIATLDSENAKLTVEFTVEIGKGYSPAGPGDKLNIGVIPVDSIFTPVRKVNFIIEKVRVGQLINCDRLILDVWTDSTITAVEAVNRSTEILINGLSLFRGLDKSVPQDKEQTGGLLIPPEKFNMPIDQLGLSVRTLNSLRRSKYTKVGEILGKTDQELLNEIKNFGQKSLEELKERLKEIDVLDQTQLSKEVTDEVRIEPEDNSI